MVRRIRISDNEWRKNRSNIAEEPSSLDAASIPDNLTSEGKPLDSNVGATFGPLLRHDFSAVRIHTDQRAAESAQSLNASAYSVGNHMVFADGQYSPDTSRGRALLAHELTHVVQHENAKSDLDYRDVLSSPTDAHEQEAYAVARAATGMAGPEQVPSAHAIPTSLISREHVNMPDWGASDPPRTSFMRFVPSVDLINETNPGGNRTLLEKDLVDAGKPTTNSKGESAFALKTGSFKVSPGDKGRVDVKVGVAWEVDNKRSNLGTGMDAARAVSGADSPSAKWMALVPGGQIIAAAAALGSFIPSSSTLNAKGEGNIVATAAFTVDKEKKIKWGATSANPLPAGNGAAVTASINVTDDGVASITTQISGTESVSHTGNVGGGVAPGGVGPTGGYSLGLTLAGANSSSRTYQIKLEVEDDSADYTFEVRFAVDKAEFDEGEHTRFDDWYLQYEKQFEAAESVAIKAYASTTASRDHNETLASNRANVVEQKLLHRLGTQKANLINKQSFGESKAAEKTGDNVESVTWRRASIAIRAPRKKAEGGK